MSRTRIALIGVYVLLTTTALAAGGIAELHLDAAAVSEMLGVALPEPERIHIPGVGEVTVRIGPVRDVVFREGGVEASVALAIDESVFEGEVQLRFVPRIDRLTGTAQLELDGVRVAGAKGRLNDVAEVRLVGGGRSTRHIGSLLVVGSGPETA